jgi:DNA-binding protein H-NS
MENRKLIVSENIVRERRQEMELKSRESEKDLVEEQLKNERELLEYEESLARNRLSLQEQLARESAAASVALEKDLASQREVSKRRDESHSSFTLLLLYVGLKNRQYG